MDLALNNLQRLICHQNQQTIFTTSLLVNFSDELKLLEIKAAHTWTVRRMTCRFQRSYCRVKPWIVRLKANDN